MATLLQRDEEHDGTFMIQGLDQEVLHAQQVKGWITHVFEALEGSKLEKLERK